MTGLKSAKFKDNNIDCEKLTEKNRFYWWMAGTCYPAKKKDKQLVSMKDFGDKFFWKKVHLYFSDNEVRYYKNETNYIPLILSEIYSKWQWHHLTIFKRDGIYP